MDNQAQQRQRNVARLQRQQVLMAECGKQGVAAQQRTANATTSVRMRKVRYTIVVITRFLWNMFFNWRQGPTKKPVLHANGGA